MSVLESWHRISALNSSWFPIVKMVACLGSKFECANRVDFELSKHAKTFLKMDVLSMLDGLKQSSPAILFRVMSCS